MGGFIDSNEHAVDRRMRRQAKGHGDMATRLGAIVIGNWPSHRQVGSYDHVLDREHTRTGGHPPARAGLPGLHDELPEVRRVEVRKSGQRLLVDLERQAVELDAVAGGDNLRAKLELLPRSLRSEEHTS